MSSAPIVTVRRDFLPSRHAASYTLISPLALNFSGHNVLITGAALQDGIGYATATAYAKAGASGIAILDVHPIASELITRLKYVARAAGRQEPTIITQSVDISDLDAVKSTMENIADAFGGRLDVLINNAAVQEPYKAFLEADPTVYWRTWEVNVHGLFNVARVFLPMLFDTRIAHNGICTMINVASSGALSARHGGSSYRTSKLAILRWTEALQLEYADQGLVTFCVNPGAVKTSMTVNEPEALRNKLPHRPEIAGDTIAWLSSQRWEWFGGRYLSCPWDMQQLMEKKEKIVAEDMLKVCLAI